jgi:hypothetical protein
MTEEGLSQRSPLGTYFFIFASYTIPLPPLPATIDPDKESGAGEMFGKSPSSRVQARRILVYAVFLMLT